MSSTPEIASASRGSEVIFLVSQPRAGSTLLQRILGRHPAVETRSEPWLMLPPLYALRAEGWAAEYGARWCRAAVEGFISALPAGQADYEEGLRRMYGYLYSRCLGAAGKQLFLDKTPRYYLILPELARTFPEARFVILLRHPGAVLDSILRTWVGEDRHLLRRFALDLFRGPRLLAAGIRDPPARLMIVRFEQLVAAPEQVVRPLCDWLGLEFSTSMLAPSAASAQRWEYGDQGSGRQHPPDPGAADRWASALEDAQRWRDSRDYLEALGDGLVGNLGYDAGLWRERLAASRPAWARRISTRPLTRYRRGLWRLAEEPVPVLRRLSRMVRREGWTGTAVRALEKLRAAAKR